MDHLPHVAIDAPALRAHSIRIGLLPRRALWLDLRARLAPLFDIRLLLDDRAQRAVDEEQLGRRALPPLSVQEILASHPIVRGPKVMKVSFMLSLKVDLAHEPRHAAARAAIGSCAARRTAGHAALIPHKGDATLLLLDAHKLDLPPAAVVPVIGRRAGHQLRRPLGARARLGARHGWARAQVLDRLRSLVPYLWGRGGRRGEHWHAAGAGLGSA